jgi:iron complex transport system ATP-binding protein
METLRQRGRSRAATVVVALHDLNLAYRYADIVVVMDQGRLVAAGRPRDVLTLERIRLVYGVEALMVKNEHGEFILPVRGQSPQ